MQLTRNRLAGTGFRGALSTRQGALALALLCALAAAVVLIFALGRYKHSINPVTKQATVLVATGLIQKGESGNVIAAQQLYKPMPALDTQLPAGAITDASLLRDKVAVNDILPGQQLTLGEFTAAGGVISQLAPTQRAVSLSLDEAHGLGGVLQAGDHVDVYGNFNVQQTPVLSLMVRNAVVLKAPGAPGAAGSSASGGTVVLQVSNEAAPTLAYASDNAKIWLVLRPGNAVGPGDAETTQQSILFGVRPDLKGAATATSASSPATSTGVHP